MTPGLGNQTRGVLRTTSATVVSLCDTIFPNIPIYYGIIDFHRPTWLIEMGALADPLA